VPAWLDWEQWIGPAPFVEYSPKIAPFNWRGWWDYGTGALGDIACHYLGMIDRAIQPGPPLSVHAVAEGGTELSPPIVSTVTYEFAKGLKYVRYDGQKGAKFVPETWTLARGEFNRPGNEILNGLDHKKYDVAVVGDRATFFRLCTPSRLGRLSHGPHRRVRLARPHPATGARAKCLRRMAGRDPGQDRSIRVQLRPLGPIHRKMVLLGVLAQRFPGQKLEWDHEAMAVKGRPELAKLIRREYRSGWEVRA